jgi:hypothetical protein
MSFCACQGAEGAYMTAILQRAIPFDPLAARRLPGTGPLEPDGWIMVDDAFGAQMTERARLLATRPGDVLRLDPAARGAADELLETVLDLLARRGELGFDVREDRVVRPDGGEVALDRADPMQTLGHLVQEDLCILQKIGDEHVLTGAVLCFPASWRLDEKFHRPMLAIHGPVADYDRDLATRVQRMLDGVRPGRPLWRFNQLWYQDAALFQPRSEHAPRRPGSKAVEGPYLRSERQCLVRLPESGAVVFSIHTFVMASEDVPR